MQSQMIVPFEDLRYLSIECGKCATQIIVDLAAASHDPQQCPCCFQHFDDVSVRGHIAALASAYAQIPKTGHRFSFRITDTSTPQ